MSKKITVVTHSSKFHNDDIFAVATTLIFLESKGDVEVIRSRDKDVISKGDYVMDVGGIYNPDINRFDHHQSGGAGVRENGVPYASFGLVWKKFGPELCENQDVANRFDEIFVQPIDSSDNGVQLMEPKIKGFYPFDVSLIVNTLSPTWKENDTDIDEVFMEMVTYAKSFLKRAIKVRKDLFEAESRVLEAYNKAEDKRLIELDEKYPWEEVLSKFPEPLYVIYKKRIDNNWSIKCVTDDFFLMKNRKLLPEDWAGKMDMELEKVTGISGSIFCHNKRFMAVAKTREAILEMASMALKD